MSSFDIFNDLYDRCEVLSERSFKELTREVGAGPDGLNLMLKAYKDEKTGKPVTAISRVKNMILLRALYDKDFIDEGQLKQLQKKATSTTYISNTLKELNPEAHERLFGDAQKSDEVLDYIKSDAEKMLRFGLTNLRGKNFKEEPVEDTPTEPDAKELEDEVDAELVKVAKGLTSQEVEDTVLDFDDVDVNIAGLSNRDEISAKITAILNGAGYNAGLMSGGEGFNVEGPIGSFGGQDTAYDNMIGLIQSYFPDAGETAIDVRLNTSVAGVEDQEGFDDFDIGPQIDELVPDGFEDVPVEIAVKDGPEDYSGVLRQMVTKDKEGFARDMLKNQINGESKEETGLELLPTSPTRTTKMLDSYKSATANYLTEQVASDTRNKKPEKEKNQSFKEKYKPSSRWQLEELRRYGL